MSLENCDFLALILAIAASARKASELYFIFCKSDFVAFMSVFQNVASLVNNENFLLPGADASKSSTARFKSSPF